MYVQAGSTIVTDDQKQRRFEMRADDRFLKRVDDWRRHQKDLPNRSEAIRRLVELALDAAKKGSK